MIRLIKQIIEYRELLVVLTQRTIRIRYKGSALGFLWSLLNPIFMIAVYAVFLQILLIRIPIPVLVTGIVVWQFLAMCMGDSLHAILGNANLVKKTSFPRIILPMSMIGANLLNFLLSFLVLIGYLLIARADFGNLAWLPLLILTQAALCLGVSLIFSAANVFFRDTEHSLQIISMAWFFLTPVVYPLSYPLKIMEEHLPAFVQTLYFLNPMAGLVSAYRAVLLSSPWPRPTMIAVSLFSSWAILALGVLIFQKAEKRFGDEL